jgi:hypothetical protein
MERAGQDRFVIPPWRHRGVMLWSAVVLFGVAPPMFVLRVADARWIGWLAIVLALVATAWNFLGTTEIALSPQGLIVTWRLFGVARRRRLSLAEVTRVRAVERRLDRTRLFQALAIDGPQPIEVAMELSDEEIVELARTLDQRLERLKS